MKNHRYHVLRPEKITQQTFIVTYANFDYLAADVRKRIVDSFVGSYSGKSAEEKAEKLAADLTTTRSILHAITSRDDSHEKVNAQKLAAYLFIMDDKSKASELTKAGEASKETLLGSYTAFAVKIRALEARIKELEAIHLKTLEAELKEQTDGRIQS